MSKKIYIVWGRKKDETLMLSIKPWEFILLSKNILIIFIPKEVRVSGPIEKHVEESYGKKRYIYVKFSEKLLPLTGKGEYVLKRKIIENFEVRITDLDFTKYLTIIMPGTFLYNYALLSDDELIIETSTKKEVYFEKLKELMLTIYFV